MFKEMSNAELMMCDGGGWDEALNMGVGIIMFSSSVVAAIAVAPVVGAAMAVGGVALIGVAIID